MTLGPLPAPPHLCPGGYGCDADERYWTLVQSEMVNADDQLKCGANFDGTLEAVNHSAPDRATCRSFRRMIQTGTPASPRTGRAQPRPRAPTDCHSTRINLWTLSPTAATRILLFSGGGERTEFRFRRRAESQSGLASLPNPPRRAL